MHDNDFAAWFDLATTDNYAHDASFTNEGTVFCSIQNRRKEPWQKGLNL